MSDSNPSHEASQLNRETTQMWLLVELYLDVVQDDHRGRLGRLLKDHRVRLSMSTMDEVTGIAASCLFPADEFEAEWEESAHDDR